VVGDRLIHVLDTLPDQGLQRPKPASFSSEPVCANGAPSFLEVLPPHAGLRR
jgi:hypothetical protein